MDADRTLVAIMLADIAGYSALMERDETRTFLRLQALRENLVAPKVSEYGGRIVKTTGDGFLAVFPSATACLGCGIAIQRANIAQESNKDEQERFHFRMGINLGDVIIDGDDISGNGVNVAARLEPLSPLDGICVSGAVRDQVREDLGLDLEDIGDQRVKNISRPIRAYRIYVAKRDVADKFEIKRNSKASLAGIFVLFCVLLSVAWFIYSNYEQNFDAEVAPISVASDSVIRAAATAQEIPLPESIVFSQPQPKTAKDAARYIGAWSSGETKMNGKGRRVMMLVEDVSKSGDASGEWAFSGPNEHTARQTPAGYAHFYGSIKDGVLAFSYETNKFRIRMTTEDQVVVELDGIGDRGPFRSTIALARLR